MVALAWNGSSILVLQTLFVTVTAIWRYDGQKIAPVALFEQKCFDGNSGE